MTVSEARAILPEVLARVAAGEEITITRYGSPVAVVVRPDIVWRQAGTEAVMDETEGVLRILRERARRHGRSLEQELRAILDAAENVSGATRLPPIRLATVRTAVGSTWSREEIYGDEGR
jgi:antitoxin (DNA-binding transcriptional repressor) of toxin-antitoxin stability system